MHTIEDLFDFATTATYCTATSTRIALGSRIRRSERGEGVISTAIAVLIMALLGVAMYATFSSVVDTAGKTAESEVDSIADNGGGGGGAPAGGGS